MCILPDLHVTVEALREGGERKDVKFSFSRLAPRARDIGQIKRDTHDILWHMPKQFPAIDYAAYVTFEGELCLLAIQVSIQQSNAKGKLTKTIGIPSRLTDDVIIHIRSQSSMSALLAGAPGG